jgi:hypothetical protein
MSSPSSLVLPQRYSAYSIMPSLPLLFYLHSSYMIVINFKSHWLHVRGHPSVSLPSLSSPPLSSPPLSSPTLTPVHMYIPPLSVPSLGAKLWKPTALRPQKHRLLSSTFHLPLPLLPLNLWTGSGRIGIGPCDTTVPSAITWMPICGRLGTRRLGTAFLCISFVDWPSQGSLEHSL